MRIAPMLVCGSALLLAACGGSAGTLMGKSLPDETRVIDGPTLALPPQFELRPPREARDYESVLQAQKTIEARQIITGDDTAASATTVAPAAGSDAWLVQQTAAQSGVVADANIREELKAAEPEEKKAEEASRQKQGLFQRWMHGAN